MLYLMLLVLQKTALFGRVLGGSSEGSRCVNLQSIIKKKDFFLQLKNDICNLKGQFTQNFDSVITAKQLTVAIDIHIVLFFIWKSVSTTWLTTFFKISSSAFSRRKKLM